MHVDCCVGGFLLPFFERLGLEIPTFDFRVPAVCSISADLHKHGYAAKPASTVSYRSQALQDYHFVGVAIDDWQSGMYKTHGVVGSRQCVRRIAPDQLHVTQEERQSQVGAVKADVSMQNRRCLVVSTGITKRPGVEVQQQRSRLREVRDPLEQSNGIGVSSACDETHCIHRGRDDLHSVPGACQLTPPRRSGHRSGRRTQVAQCVEPPPLLL